MYDPRVLKREAAKLRCSGYFNANWYIATYKDVQRLGMDPAEHYLKYGASMRRNPGPEFSTGFYLDTHPEVLRNGQNPLLHYMQFYAEQSCEISSDFRAVLRAAANVAERGDHTRAIALAERYLPEDLAYSANILRANAAITDEREGEWLNHLNAYLAHFNLAPLVMEGQGALINRFSTLPLPAVTGGPLISVIMPVFNSEATVIAAACSILNQTWRNLELLIVDDASNDGTWSKIQEIVARDDRVKIRRNKVNVGPYVSKNIALLEAKGDWITGQDADDWSHPQRLEHHLGAIMKNGNIIRASRTYLIRMEPDGRFDSIDQLSADRLDGVALLSPVSALFKRDFLVDELGSWDCARFGADNELISRAAFRQGKEIHIQEIVSMICLDLDGSLTNNPHFGIGKKYGFGHARRAYHRAWKSWHAESMTVDNLKYEFPPLKRNFTLPELAYVSQEAIKANMTK